MAYQLEIHLKRDQYAQVAERMFDPSVWKFLTKDLHQLIIDSLILGDVFRHSSYLLADREELFSGSFIDLPATRCFFDYSFILAPTYKFFEGYIYLISIKLKIITAEEAQKISTTVGALTNLEGDGKSKFKKVFETITSEIEDKSVRSRWQSLYDLYSDFRNAPAHYGEKILESYEQVENARSAIITAVNNTCTYFFEKEILKPDTNSYFESVFSIRK